MTTEYSTLRELEDAILENIPGELVEFDVAADQIDKELYTFGHLDSAIAGFTEDNFQLDLGQVPRTLKYFMSMIIPEERVDEWLVDKTRFAGRSAQDLLSTLDSWRLYKSVKTVTEPSDTFITENGITVPPCPTNMELFHLVRLAQYEQLMQTRN